jgi:hypothetical protein
MGDLVQKLTIRFDSGPPKEKLPSLDLTGLVVSVNLVLITILNFVALWFMVQ